MKLTKEQLLAIAPKCPNPEEVLSALEEALEEFPLNNLPGFMAQVCHESGGFRYVKELASGTAYEGRKDLGNLSPGDGVKYKGRGYIQITGRFNYGYCGQALNLDLLNHPELLEKPLHAARSAAWYWQWKNLDSKTFMEATKLINGGYNGLESRKAYLAKAESVLISKKEPTMALPALPILKFIWPTILAAAPDLVKIFTDKDASVPERNIKGAEKVLEIAKTITDSVNEQELATKLETQPEIREAFQKAIKDNWFDLVSASPQGLKEARSFYLLPENRDKVWGNLSFIQVLALLLVSISAIGAGYVLTSDIERFSADLRGAIVTMIIVGGFVGVKEFFFGSSEGSRRKDEDKVNGD